MTGPILAALAVLLFSSSIRAHCTIWHESLYGYNFPYQSTDSNQNYDSEEVSNPLRRADNLTITKWWAHGLLDYPPPPDAVMNLPSGGVFQAEFSQSRHDSSMRDPSKTEKPLPDIAACNLHYSGPLVTSPPPIPSLLGGVALAVAYESDVTKIQPKDMVVFSVNVTAPFYRLTDFHIPIMPPCPGGRCHCSFNWIHLGMHNEGYPYERYNDLYVCNFTGPTDPSKTLEPGSGQIPVLCENDASLCVTGRKQPMYLYQVDGNNVVEPGPQQECPSHNSRYGFDDGAQMLWPDSTTSANDSSTADSSTAESSSISRSLSTDSTASTVASSTSINIPSNVSMSTSTSTSLSSTPIITTTNPASLGGDDNSVGSPSISAGGAFDASSSAVLSSSSSPVSSISSSIAPSLTTDTPTSPIVDLADGNSSSTANASSSTDPAASSPKTCPGSKRSRTRLMV
ncbi:hypothetical protein BCR39DRAFT_308787 [Naematelia encephala]|uniref:Uncharacterized protein n=1 Tax=Naematelia encephala TaxID=71784 RepID=A0A1Y2ASZ5_9TREE|nr:hypothetical protein BCR39DRAFT_308787 [Naematelia encephala]